MALRERCRRAIHRVGGALDALAERGGPVSGLQEPRRAPAPVPVPAATHRRLVHVGHDPVEL
jgi:hypothetical protein